MIAYEELEKALARWKTRRSNAPEGQSAAEAQGAPDGQEAAPAHVDVPGEVHSGYQNPDSTGELDLTDAEVSEA